MTVHHGDDNGNRRIGSEREEQKEEVGTGESLRTLARQREQLATKAETGGQLNEQAKNWHVSRVSMREQRGTGNLNNAQLVGGPARCERPPINHV